MNIMTRLALTTAAIVSSAYVFAATEEITVTGHILIPIEISNVTHFKFGRINGAYVTAGEPLTINPDDTISNSLYNSSVQPSEISSAGLTVSGSANETIGVAVEPKELPDSNVTLSAFKCSDGSSETACEITPLETRIGAGGSVNITMGITATITDPKISTEISGAYTVFVDYK